METVGEVMTTGKIHTVLPYTPVIEGLQNNQINFYFCLALELVVEKNVTGLPVVDEENKVVGVVSDFDLLALDLSENTSTSVFPSLDQSWEVFHNIQTMIAKSEGKMCHFLLCCSSEGFAAAWKTL